MRASPVLGAALAAGQVVYGLDAPRPPWATRAIVALYLTTSTADAIEQRGRAGAAVVAAAGATGLAAEFVGVHTGRPFGAYGYSAQLGPRVKGVPLLAGAAWALLARPSRVAAAWATRRVPGVARRRAARVAVAAAALTAWDVFLDPRMVREGYWTWPGGGRYEEVPASNFAGWWLTGLVLFAAAEVLDPGDDPALPAAAPLVAGERAGDGALVLYAWTLVGELIANLLLWRRPKVAAAGSLAMGLVALPALRARLRRGD